MKKVFVLSLVGVFSTMSNADTPFGLKTGMTLEEVKNVSGSFVEVKKNYYTFKTVPKPYDGFDSYMMIITEKNGLCKILASSKMIETNAYGDGIKKEYKSLKELLEKKYGKPSGDYDFLRARSIWKNPNEWTMSLYKGERVLSAGWEPKEAEGVKNILLKGMALTGNIGAVSLAYELSNTSDCYKEMESKDISSL